MQEDYYSGKRHTNTLKFQLVVDEATESTLQVALAQTQVHDVTLARQHTDPLPDRNAVLGGLRVSRLSVGRWSVRPFKNPKRRALEPEEKAFNQCLAQVHVQIEHHIRSLKTFRILKGVYRERRQRFELRLNLIAGLVNHLILNPYYFRKISNTYLDIILLATL
ncbi:MAG: hypothetical protein E6Q85_07985 [Thiothrix sp.]|nr:MAG: hypothetical protein E6Q85_07985 [Thiothrix sp.]